jgi:hypothetical protein
LPDAAERSPKLVFLPLKLPPLPPGFPGLRNGFFPSANFANVPAGLLAPPGRFAPNPPPAGLPKGFLPVFDADLL